MASFQPLFSREFNVGLFRWAGYSRPKEWIDEMETWLPSLSYIVRTICNLRYFVNVVHLKYVRKIPKTYHVQFTDPYIIDAHVAPYPCLPSTPPTLRIVQFRCLRSPTQAMAESSHVSPVAPLSKAAEVALNEWGNLQNLLLVEGSITLRIVGPSKLAILSTLPLLYRFKPFHGRVQDP